VVTVYPAWNDVADTSWSLDEQLPLPLSLLRCSCTVVAAMAAAAAARVVDLGVAAAAWGRQSEYVVCDFAAPAAGVKSSGF